MDLLLTKFVTMIILALASFLIGLSTIKLRKVLGLQTSDMKRSQTFITSILLCFGAGVLLATSMLHILPEIRHGMEEAQESMGISCLAELVVCAGFFLIYLVEEMVHLTLHSTPHTEQLHRTVSLRKTKEQADSTCNAVQECCEKDSDCHNDMEMNKTSYNTAKNDPKCEVPGHSTQSTGHSHSHLPGTSSSALRDFFTVLALSFHAVFEGLAVGLEKDTHDVWALFTAISVHKFVITFCVSLELLQTGSTMLVFFSYLVTFSLVSPIGIGVGMLISGMGTDDELTVAVLQGLAGGTILYIVMFEVLQREKEKEVSGICQLFGILAGFCAMMTIQLLAHHDHAHDEHGEVAQNVTLLSLYHLGVELEQAAGSIIGNTTILGSMQ